MQAITCWTDWMKRIHSLIFYIYYCKLNFFGNYWRGSKCYSYWILCRYNIQALYKMVCPCLNSVQPILIWTLLAYTERMIRAYYKGIAYSTLDFKVMITKTHSSHCRVLDFQMLYLINSYPQIVISYDDLDLFIVNYQQSGQLFRTATIAFPCITGLTLFPSSTHWWWGLYLSTSCSLRHTHGQVLSHGTNCDKQGRFYMTNTYWS